MEKLSTFLIFVIGMIEKNLAHPGHGPRASSAEFGNVNLTKSELELNNTAAIKGNLSSNLSEAYIYGTLSVLVVSLLSLGGVILIPFIKRKIIYNGTMLFFMSLAVGTMASDAILHLIPEILELHGHSAEKDDGHNHESEEKPDKPYLYKMVALLATLYGLYLLELGAQIGTKIAKAMRSVGDSSATIPPSSHAIPHVIVKTANGDPVEMKSMTDHHNQSHTHGHDHGHGHGHSHGGPGSRRTSIVSFGGETRICGLKSVAFVVVVSDAMHNFTDGLAIGAAFVQSTAAGLAVSIAVICHELPHEVGDFAILLNTGMSWKKALFLNFISALTSFAGLYPGIIAGQQDSLRQWVFAVVAGGFLYVALAHMLREIKTYGSLPWHLSMILQNVGLLLGFVIVFLLAIYEDQLGG